MNDFASKAFALQMCTGNSETLDTVRFVYNGAYRQDLDKPFSFGERVTVMCDCQHVEWTVVNAYESNDVEHLDAVVDAVVRDSTSRQPVRHRQDDLFG